jgi:phosphatidylserine decarboxylase
VFTLQLTRYGTDVLLAVLAVVVVFVLLAIWTDERWLRYILLLVALFLTGFSLNFFRDPDRQIAANGRSLDKLVVSPADGKIVLIEQINEPEFIKGQAQLVSIFMSPLDVHVNRAPITGTVDYFKYIKGEFLVAHDPAAVHRNERAVIGLESAGHKVLFQQVAGYIARRIVCPVKQGDTLRQAERFGMIKFGSRVDIYLPMDVKLNCKIGDRTVAGETVLAEYP